MIIKNSVLLLKSQTGGGSTDKYQQLLDAAGYIVNQVNTLVFEFKNIDTLKEKLEDEIKYEGIIFSSPRCVEAVILAKSEKEQLKTWRSKHNFSVGEATFKDAFDKLGLECEGKESGNALNLSKVISQNKSLYTKPFLFPHGNLKTDTLQIELEKNKLSLEGVLVYDTLPNPKIQEEIDEVTNNFSNIPEFIVFFSPSGFHSSIEHLRKIPDFSQAKIVAIGPVTESAIKEKGYEIFGVMKNPTPRDVLDVISNK